MAVLLCLAIVPALKAQTYDALWKKVKQAQEKSLPQTVTKLTGEIFRKAESEQNSPQMFKAYMVGMEYRGSLNPDSTYTDLKRLEEWAVTAPKAMDRAILHSLLAEFYADYAANNTWQLRRRKAIVGQAPAADMREWSGNMFADTVKAHVRVALADSALLVKTSSKTYIPFVTQGDASAYYHHDMYHLLASRSIGALQSVESLADEGGASKTMSVRQLIVQIYQQMIATYRSAATKEGYLLTSLEYLQWQHEQDMMAGPVRATGGRIGLSADPYIAALNRLRQEMAAEDVCAEVYLALARYASAKQEYPSALQLCEEGIRLYPHYLRINELKNFRTDLLAPSLNVGINQMTYPGKTLNIDVHHKNLDGFTLRLYTQGKKGRLVQEQHFDLRRPANYRQVDTTLIYQVPDVGAYRVQVVPDTPTGKKEPVEEELAVSRFKLLSVRLPDNQCQVVALDAQSGQPVRNATVTLYDREKKPMDEFSTKADGKTTFPWKEEYRYVKASKGTDTAMPLQTIYGGMYLYSGNDKPMEKITLITDRTLYRPGQTVYVKGIVAMQGQNSAQVVDGKNYSVELTDANWQKVATKEVRTNEFGSFTTDFTLPAVCLNGTFRFTVKDITHSFRVEEYKRPTFDVTFEKPKGGYRLGDSLQVAGVAKSYSGVPLADREVSYTIWRQTHYWWRIVGADFLASGKVKSDADGAFRVPIRLLKDTDLEQAYCRYIIEATVTSVAGETQTGILTLAAGSRSLSLFPKVDDRICKDNPFKLTMQVRNLNEEPVEVSVNYSLYRMMDEKTKRLEEGVVAFGKLESNKEVEYSWKNLRSGAYLLKASTQDEQGRPVEVEQELVFFSAGDKRPPINSPVWYYAENTEFDADHPAVFSFGTSLKDTYILMNVCAKDRILESRTLALTDSIVRFSYPYQASYGDGLTVNFCFVKEGKVYQQQIDLKRRAPQQNLTLKWAVFRDKLRPGQQEEWKLTVSTPQGKPADAELLALMYDASLDKLYGNDQPSSFGLSYYRRLPNFVWAERFINKKWYDVNWEWKPLKVPELVYDRFIGYSWQQYSTLEEVAVVGYAKQTRKSVGMVIRGKAAGVESRADDENMIFDATSPTLPAPAPAETDVTPRTNFAETAFFYPQLRTNKQGEVSFAFTLPESLTRWNFQGYAHTRDMRMGTIHAEATTSKEFMLSSNLPRFVRVGDRTSVAASLSNLTGTKQAGTVVFTLFDPLTEKVLGTQKKTFNLEAGQTAGVSFLFTADDRYELLGCRLVADSGTFSDGEQSALPVLSNEERIVETLALPVRGKQTHTFALDSLFNRHSKTATHRRLTVEMAGNPAWYAVQALPSLSLPGNDNAISWATAYYANQLAAHIATSQPRLKAMIEAWKQQGGTKETFLSSLQKNQEVKNILLSESPWVLEAQTEQQQKDRLATLFDVNNIAGNRLSALTKLKQLQNTDGSWPWYKGMAGSRYITTYMVGLMARLSALTHTQPEDVLLKGFGYLEAEAQKEYEEIQRQIKKGDVKPTALSGASLQYLYLSALIGQPVPEAQQKAYNYFLSKVPDLLTRADMDTKARAAIVLYKAGRQKEAQEFVASLKEHLTRSDEQGMSFAFNESPYTWGGYKLQTQVDVIEALALTRDNDETVEEMKLWLLKQKQTQQWSTPVATADAIYALLMQGSDLLTNQGEARLTLGGETLTTADKGTTPGLGYIKRSYTEKSVTEAKRIEVEKQDDGVAWGAVYAEYQSPIGDVKQLGGELNVKKQLYVERTVPGGKPELQPVSTATKLHVGDKVVARLIIQPDRAMDFVQLKDQRGACFEPIDALSGYRWGAGTGYYIDYKDASTNFFFDHLSKGVYVLEYSYRVSRVGTYQAGLATMQCAYAPEYASHSAGLTVTVE
jgi:hypothetical protein